MTHWERPCFLHPLAHGSPSACCVQRHVRAHNSRAVPQCLLLVDLALLAEGEQG